MARKSKSEMVGALRTGADDSQAKVLEDPNGIGLRASEMKTFRRANGIASHVFI